MPVVPRLSLPRPLTPRGVAIAALLACSLLAAGHARAQSRSSDAPAPGASQALLDRIWAGVQRAQQHSTVCGSVTETRTSALLARPLVLRGNFCVEGTTGFRMTYTEPEPLTIIYRDRYINVVDRRRRRTEAFEASSGVARAMAYFGSPGSMDHLKEDFRVSAEEASGAYVLRMEPLAGRLKARTGLLVATFDARNFYITRLEINGRNGVRSVFDIRIERVDVPLDPATFEVYRPGRRKERLP